MFCLQQWYSMQYVDFVGFSCKCAGKCLSNWRRLSSLLAQQIFKIWHHYQGTFIVPAHRAVESTKPSKKLGELAHIQLLWILFGLASREGYLFYLGSKRYGLKEHRNVIAPMVSYCNPRPSLSTLDSRNLPPVFHPEPHLNNLMLLLTLLNTLDNTPCFRAHGVVKYFTVLHYDGMPLNIGTFLRQHNGKTFFDGIIPTIKLSKIKELYQGGNNAVHRFISDNCQ